MAVGVGMIVPAAVKTVLALVSLNFLKRFEGSIKKDRYLRMTVVAAADPNPCPALEKIFSERNLRTAHLACDLDLEQNEVRYEFVLTRHHRRIGRELSEAIAGLDGVRKIGYR